jgi:transketolase
MRTAFIQTLCRLAESEPSIWFLNGDLGYTVVEPFAERFPDRYVNCGVAEQNMAGMAAGLALSGKIVFTYSIANFPTLRCLEQIRNDICYHNLPVTIVAVGGGLTYGALGFTHHAIEDLAIMSVLPGMRVIAPGDPVETTLAMEQIVANPAPTYLRLGKAGEPVVHTSPPDFRLGRAIVVRDGNDLTAVATGAILHTVTAVADRLRREGIAMRVISMHTLKPIDNEALCVAARETSAILTVEEHRVDGGLGSRVADALVAANLNVPMQKIGVGADIILETGSTEFLRESMGSIELAAKELLVGKAQSR